MSLILQPTNHSAQISLCTHRSVYVQTLTLTQEKMLVRPELIALNQPSWLEKAEEQIYVRAQRIAHRACRVRYT